MWLKWAGLIPYNGVDHEAMSLQPFPKPLKPYPIAHTIHGWTRNIRHWTREIARRAELAKRPKSHVEVFNSSHLFYIQYTITYQTINQQNKPSNKGVQIIKCGSRAKTEWIVQTWRLNLHHNQAALSVAYRFRFKSKRLLVPNDQWSLGVGVILGKKVRGRRIAIYIP